MPSKRYSFVYDDSEPGVEPSFHRPDKRRRRGSPTPEPPHHSSQSDEVKRLREMSRMKYLDKRATEKLALLRSQVANETAELDSEEAHRLSRREKQAFANNRELLQLSEERAAIDDYQDGYRLPEIHSAQQVLFDHRDQRGTETQRSEYEQWEMDQSLKAKNQIHCREAEKGEYDFLLEEDVIQFVGNSTNCNDFTHREKSDVAILEQIATDRMKVTSIQKARESLPIYQYRQGFLEAMCYT